MALECREDHFHSYNLPLKWPNILTMQDMSQNSEFFFFGNHSGSVTKP